MESRSGRRLGPEPRRGARGRLGSQPPRGGGSRRRPQPARCPDGDEDGVDRISGLPDDLIREVLVRLRCTSAAARTSVLSSRWRGLWRHLPDLYFRGISPDALRDALAQVACSELSVLDINTTDPRGWCLNLLSAAGAFSLLRTAARLAPEEFIATLGVSIKDETFVVPSFHRAKSIKLRVSNFYYPPPLAVGGEFPVLERLSIAECHFNIADLISQCPGLRVLEVVGRDYDIIRVHSATLEELIVDNRSDLGGIDIITPKLKVLTLATNASSDFSMSFSAPIVEDLSCECSFGGLVRIDGFWSLRHLNLWMEEGVYILLLCILSMASDPHALNLQEIAQLPNISVLELYIGTYGHVYGATVFNLLGIYTDIQKLKLVLQRDASFDKACPSNCPCAQPHNWRSQNISLTALKVVEIEYFRGSSHEIDFLKLLFRCVPLMERVTVKPCPDILPSFRACKEICNIFKANPSVKCYVYDSSGKKVPYARSAYASRCNWKSCPRTFVL
uniref:F-box domain-containing protein n=1 Tax=Arundo donax TaxID=35708 RepID=A0A0A9CVF5_ARUDO